MGLFDNTRDLFNGFTPGRKKKYSPFLTEQGFKIICNPIVKLY